MIGLEKNSSKLVVQHLKDPCLSKYTENDKECGQLKIAKNYLLLPPLRGGV